VGFWPYLAPGGLGLLALPWWFNRDAGRPGPPGWAWPLVALLGLGSMLVGSQAPAFAFSVGVWWLVAQLGGRRLSYLPGLGLLAASTLAGYLSALASVPLRLHLGQAAAAGLRMAGLPAQAQGNLIQWPGHEFLVDAGCAGLAMLGVSTWLGLGLLAWVERATGRTLGLATIVTYLLGLAGLNLVANLLRIWLLVILQAPAGSALHEGLGLACWGLYVLAPATWFTARWVGLSPKAEPAPVSAARLRAPGWTSLALLAVLGLRVALAPSPSPDQQAVAHIKPWPGYHAKPFGTEVLQLSKPGVLAYIKPIAGFYGGTHEALICWRGSGYQLAQVQLAQVAGREIFTGVLAKGGQRFHTAWWYDNGEQCHTSQWAWRLDVLLGAAPYRVVNVSATTPGLLSQAINEALPTAKP
jgi:exosortase N